MSSRITRQQWKGLIAAWLGWAFDGLDGYLYVLVAIPFVAKLLNKPTSDPEVAFKSAIIMGVFLMGWAVGGAVFGRIGDRLGRSRTLTLTILTYAIFTGMAFFATQWWHLLIFRFIAALGIGGEWAAGSALVAEIIHPRHRVWAGAALQSGYMFGMMAAAFSTNILSAFDPRYVFLVGVLPAFVTVWIRRAVPEPEEWHTAAKTQETPPISALFAPKLIATTLLVLALTSIALTTVWAFLYFIAQAIRALPQVAGWSPPQVSALVMRVTIFFTIINIIGNFFGTYLASRIGHRRTFQFMLLGALLSFTLGFYDQPTIRSIYIASGFAAFFSLGLFGMFPMYIPPLFPTLVRTLGAGITYNTGRLISGVGVFFGGAISAYAGGPHKAIFWTGFLYALGIAVALFIPEAAKHRRAHNNTCPECGHNLSGHTTADQPNPTCPECGTPFSL